VRRDILPVLALNRLPFVDEQHVLAQLLDLFQLVRGEDNRLAALAHLKKRLFQRRRVQQV
jgi:hypothetical protein